MWRFGGKKSGEVRALLRGDPGTPYHLQRLLVMCKPLLMELREKRCAILTEQAH
jgi:hypothetical protein